jgi:hypothetical protein
MPKLICVCASHINSERRLNALHRIIKSIENQILKPFKTIISISFEDKYANQVKDLQFDDIHIMIQLEPMKQFEHFKMIHRDYLSIIPNVDENYLMFFDDDDYFSPFRCLVYFDAIRLSKKQVIYIENAAVNMTEDESTDIEMNQDFSLSTQEYFDFACTIDIFTLFMNIASPSILKMSGCDLLFRNYLRALPQNVTFIFRDSEWKTKYKLLWLYSHIYSRNISEHGSFTVDSDLTYLSNIWKNEIVPLLEKQNLNIDITMVQYQKLLYRGCACSASQQKI